MLDMLTLTSNYYFLKTILYLFLYLLFMMDNSTWF